MYAFPFVFEGDSGPCGGALNTRFIMRLRNADSEGTSRSLHQTRSRPSLLSRPRSRPRSLGAANWWLFWECPEITVEELALWEPALAWERKGRRKKETRGRNLERSRNRSLNVPAVDFWAFSRRPPAVLPNDLWAVQPPAVLLIDLWAFSRSTLFPLSIKLCVTMIYITIIISAELY